MLYNPAYDHVFFVTRFLHGLRDEIRSAIILHRPKDVETASALALLQESELELSKKKFPSKQDNGCSVKSLVKSGYSSDKGKQKSDTKSSEDSKPNDKLDLLKAYRRDKGLCFKCGEKWSKQHQCPQQVPLHIIEELLEVLDHSDGDTSDDGDLCSPVDSSLMALSTASVPTQKKRRTMQLQGFIGKQEVLILVDSGSVSSFISESVVQQQKLSGTPISSEHFVVADGGSVSYSGLVEQLQWWTQGHCFTQDMRVLALGSFDIILGVDWLDDHSPMWVHWQQKKMRFMHQGKRIMLQGLKPDTINYRPIACHKLKGLLKRKALTHIVQLQRVPLSAGQSDTIAVVSEPVPSDAVPPEIQTVLDTFPHVFKDTTALPPQRRCDHTIDLLPGAQPVNARPYHFPPDQKDEVEKLLREMLQKGLIRTSSSPFASPVLLV